MDRIVTLDARQEAILQAAASDFVRLHGGDPMKALKEQIGPQRTPSGALGRTIRGVEVSPAVHAAVTVMSAVIATLVPANDWHPRDVDDEEGPDFYEEARTTIVEFGKEGRFNLPRPEDDVAHKLRDHTLDDLDDDERDTFFARLLPLVMAFHKRDRAAFEEEFAKRRAPGFYDPPADPGQGDLFPS